MTDKDKLALIQQVAAGAYDLLECESNADRAIMQTTLHIVEIIASFGEEGDNNA